MNYRHSLTYLPYFLVPLLLLAALNYWNGLRTVETTVSAQAQNQLNALAGEVDARLRNEQIDLTRAALSSSLKDLLVARSSAAPVDLSTANSQTVPGDLFLNLTSVLKGRAHCSRLALFDDKRVLVFQIERQQNAQGADSFVLNSAKSSPFPSINSDKQTSLSNSTLHYSIPVSVSGPTPRAGTLVADVNLSEVISDAASVLGNQEAQSHPSTFVTAVDPSAKIIYLPQHEREGQLVSSALPEFLPIAEALTRNTAGLNHFRGADGQDFVTAYSPLSAWNIGIAVGHDSSNAVASAHRWGILGVALALLGGIGATVLFSSQFQRKSAGITRVEEGLTAIAKGQLDRRIELRSSDDARAIADNINLMTERLRTQIAREEETRQFQSFVRISTMLTHDLKNAIEALSLIVGNMERHFDNEQFRADALRSLTSATDKLRAIVMRLTKPLTSLSGEHQRPKSIDLIPIIKRVEALTAEPVREKYQIQMNLPSHLFIYADPERIEKVIENLILNALEAMADKNGTLTIEAGLTTRGAATFSIKDTGAGMTQDFIDNQLFRPFATTKKRGVGLGLYTCREVVEASAGTIEVESAEGIGTTFRVVLPSASHDSRN